MGNQQRVDGMPVSHSGYPSVRNKGRVSSIVDLVNASWDIVLIWATVVSLVILGNSDLGRGLATLRLLAALPVLLFFPGYLLSVALFVRNGQLTGAERLGFSVAFSSALIVFVGLILNAINLPISRYYFAGALALLLGSLSIVATWRRATQRKDERFIPWRGWRLFSTDRVAKWSTLVIAGLLIAGLGAVAYTLTAATPTEHYTEFSALQPASGKADPPLTVTANDAYDLKVTVKNQEGRPQSYQLRLSGDNGYTETVPIGTLDQGLTWMRSLQIPVLAPAPLRYLKLELFMNDESEPYRELHLWIESMPEQSQAELLNESTHQ